MPLSTVPSQSSSMPLQISVRKNVHEQTLLAVPTTHDQLDEAGQSHATVQGTEQRPI